MTIVNTVPTRLAIVGCTASGKSSLALAVASILRERDVPAEIVCIDSMTVYRGLDVGTAKATLDEQMLVPHHCIDLVEPNEEYSVGDFQRVALAAIDDIESRGGVPILVGGTGLYVDAVVDELDIPSQFPAVRAALTLELRSGVPLDDLYARLVSLDPSAATKMEPTNERRIVRALEVCVGSGRPFSSFGPGIEASQEPGRYAMIGLEWDRPTLATRIEHRLAKQFDDGFLEEAAALLEHWGETLSKTVGQALGYRELWEFLDNLWEFDEILAEIVTHTRQFAVRQERWFRRDKRIQWLDGTESLETLVAQTLATLHPVA